MAVLTLLDPERKEIRDTKEIKHFMNDRGIIFEQWQASMSLKDSDSQETILKAYEHELRPYMEKHGYKSADVINVHKDTPNIEAIRAKFLSEHTHSEDEVRFFVDGEGQFFFHLPDRMEVFKLLCEKGDFISVPKGFTHWFDLAPKYHVKAIRVFQTQEGWVANYTNSGKEQKYNL
ncbi:MAG: 1,2-dihydroxy-3-keto-5-methylthiopentene dioxygenase [Bacteriovoracia bacterium]